MLRKQLAQAFSLGAALLGLALVPAGCETGAQCAGGYVNAQGECEGQCEVSKCKPGNVCAENRCILPCSSHDNCTSAELCTPSQDDAGDAVQLCKPGKRRPPFIDPFTGLQPTGWGWPCALGQFECAPVPPNPPGATACPNGLECDPLACADCQPDAAVCLGDPLCNVGRCGNGDPCTFNTCPIEQCRPFSCIGAGEGDANAYCSQQDCESDDQCAPGYYCGVTRDPRDICGNTCNGGSCSNDPNATCMNDGACQKGNNTFCGTTMEPCADIAALQAQGTSFFEGGVCLMRRTCLKRDACTPCSHTLDCSRGSGQVCTSHAGDNVCLRLCAKPSDCLEDEVCVPYIPASGGTGKTCSINANIDCEVPEDCPTAGETCQPRQVCVPRSGACDASDSTAKFCRHCIDDSNCGGAEKFGRWGCAEVGTGQNVCFDLAYTLECTRDQDCLLSAGGKRGECRDEDDNTMPTSSVYHRCYLPYDPPTNSFTCN